MGVMCIVLQRRQQKQQLEWIIVQCLCENNYNETVLVVLMQQAIITLPLTCQGQRGGESRSAVISCSSCYLLQWWVRAKGDAASPGDAAHHAGLSMLRWLIMNAINYLARTNRKKNV